MKAVELAVISVASKAVNWVVQMVRMSAGVLVALLDDSAVDLSGVQWVDYVVVVMVALSVSVMVAWTVAWKDELSGGPKVAKSAVAMVLTLA